MEYYKQDLINFFEYLTSKPKVGGLQISDTYIRYVLLSRTSPPYALSVNLPPGVVQDGEVRDKETLMRFLSKLNEKISQKTESKESRVVVSLPSSIAYTQNFDIPNVGKGRLKETAELNLKMNSPMDDKDLYMDWELIAETADRYELMGAFAQKESLDAFRSILLEAGFHPIIFEFPSLSLSWVVNKLVGPKDDISLILSVSGNGLDIFLLRRGYIYFDYFRSWRSIQGNKERVNKEEFKKAVVSEVARVVNFMRGRIEGELGRVLFVAPGLEDIIREISEENFGIEAEELRGDFGRLDPSWYTVIGSALRGTWERTRDDFISLGSETMEEIFNQERVISFVKLWRNIAAGVVGAFLVLYGVSSFLVSNQPALTGDQESLISSQAQRELSALSNKVSKFNSLVSAVSEVRGEDENVVVTFLNDMDNITSEFGITPNRMRIDRGDTSVTLEARAGDYNTVIEFKDALVASGKFSNVNLPLSDVTEQGSSEVGFRISFQYNFGG